MKRKVLVLVLGIVAVSQLSYSANDPRIERLLKIAKQKKAAEEKAAREAAKAGEEEAAVEEVTVEEGTVKPDTSAAKKQKAEAAVQKKAEANTQLFIQKFKTKKHDEKF